MEKLNKTEDMISSINQSRFFKEFTYSKNNFRSSIDNQELQLADNVVWLEDILFIIQIKDRNLKNVKDSESEENWFKSKVIKKASWQINKTISFLNYYSDITITNERGHKFCISEAPKDNIKKIIIYTSSDKLPVNRRLEKFYESSKAGFIHLFNSIDYKWICKILVTPTEIDDYLSFREQINTNYAKHINKLPEQAILGQFLSGNFEEKPEYGFIKYWQQLENDSNEYSLTHIIDKFYEKIEFEPFTHSYYMIIKELAKLTRAELKLFKEEFDASWKQCNSSKLIFPFRFVVPRNNIGFIIIPIPNGHKNEAKNALKNFTQAHKYDQRTKKCIGASIAKDKDDYIILWEFLEADWKYDQYWEDKLKNNSPLSKMKSKELTLYRFKKNNNY